ncbi:MAG TPA: potassium-transporting ATPase subunit KdpA [Desulfomonilia bacterium]
MFKDFYGWIQLGIFIILLICLTKPFGIYLMKVLDPSGRTLLDPILKPVEKFIYKTTGINPEKTQTWKAYLFSLLLFSLIGFTMTFVILIFQRFLPLNPQKLPGLSWHLAFNTAASFTTNTNWQSYAGEKTMSYFSQMVALTFHNFASAASGIAAAAALVRGVASNASKTIGNFWSDIVRLNLYLLIPASIIFAVFLVSEGVVDNFRAYDSVSAFNNASVPAQIIAQGPVASQEAVKMLGTNGGGFMGANSAHPFENPTPLTNFVQMLSIFLIPAGLTWYYGRMTGNQRHGWTIFYVMLALFLAFMLVCWHEEDSGNPAFASLGIDLAAGNMEGKEVRFGIFGSSLFAAVTTSASCGAVNSMFDSYTPLGGLVSLLNIQLGEIIFGGVGSGLYGMIVFIVLTVFLSGLMTGRTPEYLGKKIEAYEVKAGVLFIMVPVLVILGFTSAAAVSGWGLAGLNNAGPHGLTEMLYAFSSAAGNNGSAFAGLNADTPWYNVMLGISMIAGRFLMIAPELALAGSLAAKKHTTDGSGSFPVTGLLFAFLLAFVILIVGALTFLPVLSLGPIVEHMLMLESGVLF